MSSRREIASIIIAEGFDYDAHLFVFFSVLWLRSARFVCTLPFITLTHLLVCRGGRGGKGAERQISADGVYTNHRFMQAVGALVGLPVRVSAYLLFSVYIATLDTVSVLVFFPFMQCYEELNNNNHCRQF